MRISTTSNRLKQIMAERGLKQVDLLKMCEPYCSDFGVKLPKNYLSQYVSGKFLPKQTTLTVLGLALDVSEVWLMGYDVPRERPQTKAQAARKISNETDTSTECVPPPDTKRIPLLWKIACGKPIYGTEEDQYVEVGSYIRADFCLRCKGDSMSDARIYDGDVVFIREQPMVDNGEIAAVAIGDEATLKRVFYYKEQEKLILQPANTKHEPLVYMGSELEDIKILGKAVAFLSNVK